MTTARRLAAIMFTDVVDYTAIMAQDEQRGLAVRARHHSLIKAMVEQFHGRAVEQSGDESLSIFNSSIDAVNCALAIQSALETDEELTVRIGIHIGDVLERDGELIGDGVNIAARIRPLAEPGGVCVSMRVWEDLRNHAGYAAIHIGDKDLKNVPEPVAVYSLTHADAAKRLRASRPFWRKRRYITTGLVVLALAAAASTPPVREAAIMLAVRQGWLAAYPDYEQQVNFATTSDGVRIAYAAIGEGPPVVVVLGWFTHLESGLSSPGRNPFVPALGDRHQVVMYDGRGFGLSDRGLDDYSLEARVRDLEAVVAALGLERFGIVALSAGGSAAIAYAALHPERVSRLYLYGSFVRMSEQSRSQIRSLVPLVRSSWGQDNPAFRQVFTSLFMPEADEFTMRIFNDMQRVAATSIDAAAFLETLVDVDARAYAPRVKAPTLVSHLRGDAIIPFENGREVASLIPGARLLSIEGKNHAFLLGDPAAKIIQESMREFHAASLGSGEENP